MRIVFLPSLIAPVAEGTCFGGAEISALSLAEALAARGHEVTMIGLAGTGGRGVQAWLVEKGTPLLRPGEARRIGPEEDAAFAPIAVRLDSMAQARAFDVLHLHLNDAPALLAADVLARVHPHLAVVATLHMSAVFPETVAAVQVLAREGSPLYFTAPSRFALASYGLGEGQGVVAANGVELASIAPVLEPPQDGRLAWAGRRSREKGLLAALEIAARVERPITIAGADAPEATVEDQRELAAMIARARADDRGLVSRAEVAEIFARSAGVLVTSTIAESHSLVAVEALAAGTPVIAFDTGALREVVEDGVTGFVVPPGDLAAACAAVRRLPSLSRARCRVEAEARFSAESAVARWEAIYAEVLRSRS